MATNLIRRIIQFNDFNLIWGVEENKQNLDCFYLQSLSVSVGAGE